MLGVNVFVPFIAMVGGALFAVMFYGQGALYTGAAVGFGAGFAFVALIWLFFAVLRRIVE